MPKKKLAASAGIFVLGIVTGLASLFIIAKLPLNPENSLYNFFGIKKREIIGFQPFWLLTKTKEVYPQITTFAYFGLTLDADGTIVKLVNPQEEEPGWTTLKSERLGKRLEKARKKGQKLSLLIHQSDEKVIRELILDPEEHAKNLIADVSPLMQEYGFSDLNLDVESFIEASQSAQISYTTFVSEVKKGLKENDSGSLTVEVTPVSLIKPRLTNVSALAKIADYIVLMAYDFHYINSFLAGPVAPIGGVPDVREYDVESALEETLNVVPAEKIILGIPLYGYEWETISDKPGAATIPQGGSTASNQRVGELLAECDSCITVFDENSKSSYSIFPYENYFHQIYYESETSIKEKLALATKYKVAGVALWALGYEGEEILEPVATFKNSFDFNSSLTVND